MLDTVVPAPLTLTYLFDCQLPGPAKFYLTLSRATRVDGNALPHVREQPSRRDQREQVYKCPSFFPSGEATLRCAVSWTSQQSELQLPPVINKTCYIGCLPSCLTSAVHCQCFLGSPPRWTTHIQVLVLGSASGRTQTKTNRDYVLISVEGSKSM